MVHEEGQKSIYDWLSGRVTVHHKEKYGENCKVVYSELHNSKLA